MENILLAASALICGGSFVLALDWLDMLRFRKAQRRSAAQAQDLWK